MFTLATVWTDRCHLMTGGGNVTALTSYYAGYGRSVLVSGHADGTVRLHSVSFGSARLV